ncbi:heparinase II/III family protein [Magnetospirillum sulfuroxidans]|uniref:Heparinase II/III family protein n=1 Tax=Magnetospirillum sulfuroxidans TaxID=611300 RepID=A0ABS5IG72_9PROT|nr:heparinase II/III family protein [Magnetospirillum sulfuroxidans]MBR9973412.1 heparinase II/III family protein [Magnetospirillum sulfuroxidans]
MSLSHRLKTIRSMPVKVAAAKVAAVLAKRLKQRLIGALMRNHCTYPPSYGLVPLSQRLPRLPVTDGDGRLRRRALAAAAHRFDLLGSGSVKLTQPLAQYPDWREIIAAGHHRGNRKRSARLLAMIDTPGYVPVDWQVDFKSGYRWSAHVWGGAIAYGHKPGVDVKLPWELGRLQHLPHLALAYAAAPDERLATEFRDQVLDFLGANPPGWGVQWACAMDVAIRAANLVLAWDLFVAHGATFTLEFQEELAAALSAHGRHIAHNLEWSPAHRGNHYLADITGLAFIAAALPRSPESDLWLVFAAQQLEAEIQHQFLDDGGNFEASTAYHRLSLEMVLFAVALILGLDEDRKAAFAEYDAGAWGLTPKLAPGPMAWPPFGAQTLERLSLALGFARTVTKPSGEIVQIGDNDSGRFFILDTNQSPLDVSSLWADGLDAMVLRGLSGGHLPLSAKAGEPVTVAARALSLPLPASRLRVQVPDPTALVGLTAFAAPAFGLYGWKNERSFISIRCGRLHDGRGAHAHNDQLAVEIEIDAIAYARDPGSFTYTADLATRNAYRSALAHFVPRQAGMEPAALNLGPFRLDDTAQAEMLRFADQDFVGRHHGFAVPVWRRVRIADGAILIEDGPEGGAAVETAEQVVSTPDELNQLWGLTLPFSPGYGLRA